MDWSLGVFTVMTIIVAIIGVISGVRLIHIDKQYETIINKYELESNRLEAMLMDSKKDDKEIDISSSSITAYQRGIGQYNAKRDNNKKQGLTYDFFCIATVLILGIITTFGVFEKELLFLNGLLAMTLIMPSINFIIHMNTINENKSKKI